MPAVHTHCTGDQHGFAPGLGTPAAVTGRWALHLHRVVVGGVGSDRSFGTTGLAAVDGPELMLTAVGHCPAWHLTSCLLPALGLCQWPGESHPLPHLALTSIQHQPAWLRFHCSLSIFSLHLYLKYRNCYCSNTAYFKISVPFHFPCSVSCMSQWIHF